MRIERLEQEIREFSLQAERVDAEEDDLYGVGKQAHEISEELRRRESRLERIAEASKELEREAIRAREAELRDRVARLRKAARGFRRFSLRGIRKVSSEWTLVCLCGNLPKLIKTEPGTFKNALQIA